MRLYSINIFQKRFVVFFPIQYGIIQFICFRFAAFLIFPDCSARHKVLAGSQQAVVP